MFAALLIKLKQGEVQGRAVEGGGRAWWGLASEVEMQPARYLDRLP